MSPTVEVETELRRQKIDNEKQNLLIELYKIKADLEE